MIGISSTIAQRAAAGVSAAALAVTAALAQAPRSVTILPNAPEAPAATQAPEISAMRLELLNSTVKVENSAGVSVDLIPALEVPVGSKIGFRIGSNPVSSRAIQPESTRPATPPATARTKPSSRNCRITRW